MIDSLAVGGAERMLVEIANASVDQKHEVAVCVTRSNVALRNELKPSVPLVELNRRWRFDPQAVPHIRRLIDSFHPTVLHIHSRSTLGFVAFLRTIGVLSVPVVFHDHFGEIEIDQTVPFWFRMWGRFHVSRYVGVSPRLGEWARVAGIPDERVSVIRNALDLDRIKDAQPLSPSDLFPEEDSGPFGVVVGGIRPQKGIEILLDACSQIEIDKEWRIVVVGSAGDHRYLDTCKRLAEYAGLSRRVVFVGERQDVPSVIKSCDFGVIPSISESGPLVLIEYLAGGLPFVSTRVGEVSARVESAGMGAFVDAGDAKALAVAIGDLISMPEDERKRVGERGVEVAEAMFDIRMRIPQWREIYAAAIGSGR
jgi:glycosyltransferase involved in cell wall biosynthesis